jgi:uncharacterized membrane protein YdjX (TVP38/TMEM64 family)
MAGSVVSRPRTRWRPLVLAALIAAFVVGQVAGASGAADLDRLRDLLTGNGPWGPVAFVAGFALSHAVGFPSLALVLLAGTVWPLWQAVTISWVGGMAGTSLAYGVAAWAGHDWAMQRVPARLRRLDRRLEAQGGRLLLAVRVLLLTPAPADWLAGVASVRYRDFLAATSLGLVPPTMVLTSASGDDPRRWVLLTGLAGGAALLVYAGTALWPRGRRPTGPGTAGRA